MGARKQLVKTGVLSDTAVAVYVAPTTPSNAMVAVNTILVANTSSSAATVTVYLVPADGSEDTSNEILSAVSVAAHTTMLIDAHHEIALLSAGDSIMAKAGTTLVLNLAISGEEFS